MWFELKRRITTYHEMNLNQEGTFWSTFNPKGKDEIVFVCHIKPNSALISAHTHDATEKEIIGVEPSNFSTSITFDIDLSKTCIFCRCFLH